MKFLRFEVSLGSTYDALSCDLIMFSVFIMVYNYLLIEKMLMQKTSYGLFTIISTSLICLIIFY